LQSADGEVYEGEFKGGLKDGIGRLSSGGGSGGRERTVYTGEWKRGRKHGNGTWVSVSRVVKGSGSRETESESEVEEIYEGGWKDNQKHGRGTMTRRDSVGEVPR
jgi:hypothetical protein